LPEEKKKMSKELKETRVVHKDFFELDEDESIAHIQMEYENPSEIFDQNIITKIPRMSVDFIDTIIGAFDFVPNKFKLDILVRFDDMEGYSGEELEEIYKKNIMLEVGILKRRGDRQNKLALTLVALGLVFIFFSIYIGSVWTDGGMAADIVAFILDILATVPFWGATEIFVVDGNEKRQTASNLAKRFQNITFEEKTR